MSQGSPGGARQPGTDQNPVKILRALKGQVEKTPPVWMMRQAGRYLPEYREIRSRAGSFLELCYNPKLAAEVTLQPVFRFDFDAAILFADILLIADGLGQDVRFEDQKGPILEPIAPGYDLARLSPGNCETHLQPVFETIGRVRESLAKTKALIGFCGAPWTVATYMIAGHGTLDQRPARMAAYRDPAWFADLIDILVEASAQYLIGQVKAGCDVVQIFDSWAGVLPEAAFVKWCVNPTKRIVDKVLEHYPNIPIIGFPRGCGVLYETFAVNSGVHAVALDTSVPLGWARDVLQDKIVVQGNLDPLAVVAGGGLLDAAVEDILAHLSAKPFIFNLGHGLVPETPVDHVARVVELIKAG